MPLPSTATPPRLSWGQSTSFPAAPMWPECAPTWPPAQGSRGGPASGAWRFSGTPRQVTKPKLGQCPPEGRAAHSASGQKESRGPFCGIPQIFCSLCSGSIPRADSIPTVALQTQWLRPTHGWAPASSAHFLRPRYRDKHHGRWPWHSEQLCFRERYAGCGQVNIIMLRPPHHHQH